LGDICSHSHVATIGLLLVLNLTHGWKSRQLDLVLAYPQADIVGMIFMCLPKGFELDGRSYKLSQPLLIKQILQAMGFNSRTKLKDIPSLSSKIIHRDLDRVTHDTPREYRRVLGQLNFLKKSTRPDIAYAVHQCTRFVASPKSSLKQVMLRTGRYLMKTRDRGMIMKTKGASLELCCDEDFCSNCNPDMVHVDKSTSKYRNGSIVMFAGYLLTCASQLQTETALSTTEAEFIALSEGLRTTIPIMKLIDELRERNV